MLPLVTVFQHNYTICLVDLKKSQMTYLPVQFVWLMQVYLWISHEMHKKNTIFEVTAHIGHRKKTKKKPYNPRRQVYILSQSGPAICFPICRRLHSRLYRQQQTALSYLCALCFFFSSLFVVTDEACHAVSTEKRRRLLDALDSDIPIRWNANGALCVRFDLVNTALYVPLPPPSP